MENKKNELIIPKDSLVFIPLGGATEIGMNCYLYGYEGKWLAVDCGIGFPGEGLPGVDCLLPDTTFIAEHKKDLVGLIITHAHEDHIGAVARLWEDYQCPIYVTPFASEILRNKLQEEGLLKRADVQIIEKASLIDLNPFQVEFISMTHSIPEPNSLAIRTKKGTIVHTGDWKFEKNSLIGEKPDIKLLKEIGKEGVLALVSDSTSVFDEVHAESEEDVRESLKKVFKEHPYGKLFVTCFASNVVRVESIYHAAKESGRKVCLMGRSLWRIDDAARNSGYMQGIPEFLSEREASELPSEKVLYICTGSQGEPYSALSKLVQKRTNAFAPEVREGDFIIFSSRIIPGNEKEIALLQKKLVAKGAQIITERDYLVHVSGHPSQEDMKKLYQMLMPTISIPVHGEALHLAEHIQLSRKWGAKFSIGIQDGEVLDIDEEAPEIIGEVPVGILAMDGKKIVPLNADVIRQRRKMVSGGSCVVTVVLDKERHLIGEAQVSSFGLLDEEAKEMEELKALISKELEGISKKTSKESINEKIRLVVRRYLNRNTGKKPLIEVHLVCL
ncbi:MAG: ribonuclease J [Alphaproteobacteria bacterium]|nr:ribonuclease J [Alphaproteobacteria bacterium]